MNQRIAMFQRKGSPMMGSGMDETDDSGPQALDDSSPMTEGTDSQIAQCPNCGCQFDPATDEIVNADGKDGMSGADYQIPDSVMPGGDTGEMQ